MVKASSDTEGPSRQFTSRQRQNAIKLNESAINNSLDLIDLRPYIRISHNMPSREQRAGAHTGRH
jgi:hypothetical protein